MKNRIVGILVCTLLIAGAVLQVTGNEIVDEEKVSSSGLATIIADSKMVDDYIKNDVIECNGIAVPFYGYVAYDPSGGLPLGPCALWTCDVDPLPTPPSSSDFIAGGTWADGVWYGCEYSTTGGSNIWEIDHISGAMTLIGSSGVTGNLNGLTYDPSSGIMYACGNDDLYQIDMATGDATLIGSLGLSGVMIAIACDGLGNLYGIELITDSLYAIDPGTSSATLIGSLGIDINYAQDMAYDFDNGIMYLAAYTISPTQEGALYTCSTINGAAYFVCTFTNQAEITGFAIPYNCCNLEINPTTLVGGFSSLVGLSRIQFDIVNNGGVAATNVDYDIQFPPGTGFEIEMLRSPSTPIPTINPLGGFVTVTSGAIIAWGSPTVTIKVYENVCGSADTLTTPTTTLFIFLWSVP